MYNELLSKLAEKFGTTSEYLWGVLVRQAYIDGIQIIICFSLTCIGLGVLYGLHRKFSRTDKYGDDTIVFPMVLASIILSFLFMASFVGIIMSITNFINPEYWALKQVLNAIGGK